ncbi:MAG TPA: hypothetical protein VLL48_08270, partial [Longimicrobiales bacterium]|nr:hypothetical protein [Longimicrobiales bacterium]
TEESSGALFCVDWLGFPHVDGECLRFADELEQPVTVDRLVDFHGRVMFWFQYVDVERVNAATRAVWDTFRPALVAPAHGLVVRERPGELFRKMEAVVARVAERGRTGVA